MRAAPVLLLAGVLLLAVGLALNLTIGAQAGTLPTFIGGIITGVGLHGVLHNHRSR